MCEVIERFLDVKVVSFLLLLLLISQHQCYDDYADLWRLQ